MCPGYKNGGCKVSNPAIQGRIYCKDCQKMMNTNNRKPESVASVIRSKEGKNRGKQRHSFSLFFTNANTVNLKYVEKRVVS